MGARPNFPSSDPPIPKVVDRFFELSLLGMLAAGFFALAGSGYLDWPTSALTLLALCLRGLMAAGVVDVAIPNRAAVAFMLLATGFFPLDVWLISGAALPATVHLICLLTALKLLTAKTNRDFAYLRIIAVLELLAGAMLSVNLGFFLFLALFLLFAIAAFLSAEVRRSAQARRGVVRGGLRAFPRRLISISVFLFTGILTMTAGLFFVLPRTARAAFERFLPQHSHVSGFSESVRLGQIGEIKKSSVPVMHIRSLLSDGFLAVRWRGAALTQFDGRRWDAPRGNPTSLPPDQNGDFIINQGVRIRSGHAISYSVRLSDIAADTLFIAGTPQSIRINVPILRLSHGGAFHFPLTAASSDLAYAVYSFLEEEIPDPKRPPEPLPRGERDDLLQLPNIDSRIPPLARAMSAGAETDQEKAAAVENHLRHDYGYTLELLPADVADPLANFLFDRKKGHCEYFASSMVVMLRSLGIPSRMAVGFQSGAYNPITKLQVVRASDAHSWVEAWITGRGWTTYDPTPPDPGSQGAGVMARVALFFDDAEQFWQDWVVSYDLDRQIVLASRMDESARRWRFQWVSDAIDSIRTGATKSVRYVPWAVAMGVIALLGVWFGPAVMRWWRTRLRVRRLARGQGQATDATLLYERMLRVLARRGIQKPPWLTPIEFARVLPASEVSVVVAHLTASYNELRFGGRTNIAPQMMQLLEQLEKMS
jgi:transglutaminase-like putative cysteine protease